MTGESNRVTSVWHGLLTEQMGKSGPVSLGKRVSGIPVGLKMEGTVTTKLIRRCVASPGDQHWYSNKDVQWRERERRERGGGVQRAGGRAASDDLPTQERKEHQSVGHPHSGTECGSLSVVIYTQSFTQDCRKKCTHEQSTIYAQNS